SVADMRKEVSETFKEGYRFCYASCAHELQNEQQHRVHNFLQRFEKYRQEAIAAQSRGRTRCKLHCDSSRASCFLATISICARRRTRGGARRGGPALGAAEGR
ncbi:MAG: hypothetical protein U0793_34475, partial [Gemmataceae bacterium]